MDQCLDWADGAPIGSVRRREKKSLGKMSMASAVGRMPAVAPFIVQPLCHTCQRHVWCSGKIGKSTSRSYAK